MAKRVVALGGDLIYNTAPDILAVLPDHWVTAEDGVIVSVTPEPPAGAERLDFRGKVIVPGLVDLHLHAPQYVYRGLGMDRELLDWLAVNAFPEEARYADLSYARRAYALFTDALRRSGRLKRSRPRAAAASGPAGGPGAPDPVTAKTPASSEDALKSHPNRK